MIFLGIKYQYSPIIDITKILPCIPFNIWHTTLSFFYGFRVISVPSNAYKSRFTIQTTLSLYSHSIVAGGLEVIS